MSGTANETPADQSQKIMATTFPWNQVAVHFMTRAISGIYHTMRGTVQTGPSEMTVV
jgi:hypothetical protein